LLNTGQSLIIATAVTAILWRATAGRDRPEHDAWATWCW
jgi:hypothetical protein